MDWDTYKRLCDRPDYWSRWMLLRSAALLEAQAAPEAWALGALLRAALTRPCLQKPADHRGPDTTDMFALQLGASEAAAICRHIDAALAAQSLADAPPIVRISPRGFAAPWREYLRSREQEAAC